MRPYIERAGQDGAFVVLRIYAAGEKQAWLANPTPNRHFLYPQNEKSRIKHKKIMDISSLCSSTNDDLRTFSWTLLTYSPQKLFLNGL